MDSNANSSSHAKSDIEKLVGVQGVFSTGSDVFVNSQDLLHLAGARGVFGGITIAQSLNAAQETTDTAFVAHSMHCTFVSAGNPMSAIQYHVERVRDGRTFSTRAVRAIQNDSTILLATVSFTRPNMGRKSGLEHAEPIPSNVPTPYDDTLNGNNHDQARSRMPYLNQSVGISHFHSPDPCQKRIYQWTKTHGPISAQGGHRAHLAALACISDSYFLACVAHSHSIWEFTSPPVSEIYDGRDRLGMASTDHSPIPRPHLQYPNSQSVESRKVKMMVSLDHTIYFHNPTKLAADEWLLSEIKTSWASEERGLVYQNIWMKDGSLVASCIQEGIVRLEDLDNGRSKTETECRL